MARNDQLVVELTLPHANLECGEVRFFDGSGKQIEVKISRIEIEPLFPRKDASATVLYSRSMSSGTNPRELSRQIISVAGTSGELRPRSLSRDVGPSCLAGQAEDETESEEEGKPDPKTESRTGQRNSAGS